MIRQKLAERFQQDLLFADGFDDAIIAIEVNTGRVIYDYNKMIGSLVSDGMSLEEAVEYLDFNVLDAYVGEQTPIYAYKVN
jgi:hypothetical protein